MKKENNDDLFDMVLLGLFSIASFIIVGACLSPDDLPKKRSNDYFTIDVYLLEYLRPNPPYVKTLFNEPVVIKIHEVMDAEGKTIERHSVNVPVGKFNTQQEWDQMDDFTRTNFLKNIKIDTSNWFPPSLEFKRPAKGRWAELYDKSTAKTYHALLDIDKKAIVTLLETEPIS